MCRTSSTSARNSRHAQTFHLVYIKSVNDPCAQCARFANQRRKTTNEELGRGGWIPVGRVVGELRLQGRAREFLLE